jgi:hypothetical protein
MANLVPFSKSFIPSSKSASIKADKLLNVSSKTTNVNVGQNKNSKGLKDSLKQIERKVIKIDKLLKDSLFLSKKDDQRKRKEKETQKFAKREKQLETKKPKKEKGVNLPTPPKMGFLDWIKNFITQTILGFFAVRLIEFLPQLLKILPVIINVSDFIVDIAGKMLDGLITFVDWGYKAIDGTRGFIKNIGGEGLAQNFDKFAGAIDNIIEIAIITALVTAGRDKDSDSGGGVGKPRRGFDKTGNRVTRSAQKRYFERFGRNQFIQRFGKEGLENLPKSMRRGAVQRGARSAFMGIAGKGGAKAILGFVRPLTKRIPIIGGLLDFGLSVALGEDPGRAAFKAIGATLVGALGAAIGSLAFGVGGIIGGIIGGIGGDILGGALYDMFFKGKKPTPKKGKTNKLAGGGTPVKRGGKPAINSPRRTLKKRKKARTVSFTPTKIKAGKSVGGEDKVQSVFPNPEKAWWDPLGIFTGKKKQQEQQPQQKKPKEKTPNPQKFLVDSNDVLGKSNFFGPFFTLALKAVVGDRPGKLDYLNVGKGLNSWMQGVFQTGTLGFAGGGEVDAKQFFGGEDYTDVIAKSVEDSVSKEINTTVRNLAKEMSLRPVGKEEMTQENIRKGQEGAGEESSFSEGGISGSGVNKAVSVAKKLIADLGITPAQASGIVGNFLYESAGMNPGEREGAPYGTPERPPALGTVGVGYGWAQWTNSAPGDRLDKFLKSYGGDKGKIATDDDNYRFLMQELKGSESLTRKGTVTGTFFPKDDPQAASDWFRQNWERAGVPADEKRRKETLAVFNKIKGLSREQAKVEVEKSGGKIYAPTGKDLQIGSKSIKSVDSFNPIAKKFGLTLYSGYRPGSRGYHGIDRARDYSNDGVGLGTKEQLNFAKYVYQNYGSSLKELIYTPLGFGVKDGKRVPLSYWGPVTKSKWAGGGEGTNAIHYDHVHVAYEEGGETLDGPHLATIGEEGTEYVIDANSYKIIKKVAPRLLDILNYVVKDKTSLKKYLPNIIESLSAYTDYESPEAEVVFVPINSPGNGAMSRGGAVTMMVNQSIDIDSDYGISDQLAYG